MTSNFPEELCTRKQWLVWKFEPNETGGKPRKMPYYISGKRRTGKQGGDDDRAALVDCMAASDAVTHGEYDGLGFAFLPGDGLIGIDLDGCFNTDDTERHSRAVKIIEACNSYTEVSPSGNGVHIIVAGESDTFKSNALGIEVFCGRQFFTMTGTLRAGSPFNVNPIEQDTITKLRRTVKGDDTKRAPAPSRPVFRDGEPPSIQKIESALAFISPDCGYDDWIRIGMALQHELGDGGKGVWAYWSGRSAKYCGDKDIDSHWRSFGGGNITGGTLFKMAMDAGWRPPRPAHQPALPQPEVRRAPEGIVDQETGEIIPHKAGDDRVFINPKAPYDVAKQYIETRHMVGDMETLHYWRGDFYMWNSIHYQQVNEDRVRAELYEWLSTTWNMVKQMDEPVQPNMKLIAEVYSALKAIRLILVDEPPTWIRPPHDGCPASDIIPCWNGFLRISTRRLEPARPELFVTAALSFDAEENPKSPFEWLRFINQIWHGDMETQEALAEAFGYLLTDATDQQKMILLCGVKRSGKGTILRILGALVGKQNTVSPSLSSLGTQFGLQPLIGKRVAMISDARLSHKSDQASITENILRITGEDDVSIERKYKETWSGKLTSRFVMATNETPNFSDASAAITSRMIPFVFVRSFLGKEDFSLTKKLENELPGILMWALDGLVRMRKRGRLLQPASGRVLSEQMEEMTSPISAFVEECCKLEPAATVGKQEIFDRWRDWCEQQGRDHAGNQAMFGRQLNAAHPEISSTQHRVGQVRQRVYLGIRLRRSSDVD